MSHIETYTLLISPRMQNDTKILNNLVDELKLETVFYVDRFNQLKKICKFFEHTIFGVGHIKQLNNLVHRRLMDS